MIDAIAETAYSVADGWKEEVKQRRRISSVDPVADAIEYCAADLCERIARAAKVSERLSPEEYAALPHVGVSAQAVRRWCRLGQLPGAIDTEKGWQIPREAKRVRALTPAKPTRSRRASR